MFKYLVAALAVMSLSACMDTKNVRTDASALAGGNYRTYVIALREKPDFRAVTPGKAIIGGAIGAVAVVVAGNKIIRENGIADPAVHIGESLAAALAAKHGLQQVDARGRIAHSTDVVDLSRGYGDADLVVDVQTTNWSFF